MVKNVFSLRVRQLRESHQLSLAQLSDILGKKRSAISDIESGRIGTTLETLTALANLFAVSADWLLERTDEMYSITVIERLEQELIDLEKEINLTDNTNLLYIKALMDGYVSLNYFSKGKFKCSIEQRANVIHIFKFWINIAKKLDEMEIPAPDNFYRENLQKFINCEFDSDTAEDEIIGCIVSGYVNAFCNTRVSKRVRTARYTLFSKHKHILNEVLEFSQISSNNNENKGKDCDTTAQCRYINEILRNRLSWSYYNELRGLKALLKAKENGVNMDVIETLCKKIDTWTQFKALMKEYNIEL